MLADCRDNVADVGPAFSQHRAERSGGWRGCGGMHARCWRESHIIFHCPQESEDSDGADELFPGLDLDPEGRGKKSRDRVAWISAVETILSNNKQGDRPWPLGLWSDVFDAVRHGPAGL